MEPKNWKITVDYREVTDDEGNVPVNGPIEYKIDMTEAKGLDCDAILSSAMTIAETMVEFIKKSRNEKNNLQLSQSETND